MNRVRSGDAEICYETLGDGPPVVLLHPFPVHHAFWKPAAQFLINKFRVILPDLRCHGDSDTGEGPATMDKHALDLIRVLDDADVGRAPFIGVSIGGYALFEFWRRFRGRVAGLILCNTKAGADNAEGRAARLKAAEDVLEYGTEQFFEGMLKKVLGKSTLDTRPDLVDGALRMMRKMSPQDVALVQRGMADRPDSIPTLKTINIPTLLVTGDEDQMTGVAEAQLMHQHIAGSQVKIVAKAGHYSPWEQPEELGRIARQFLDTLV